MHRLLAFKRTGQGRLTKFRKIGQLSGIVLLLLEEMARSQAA